MVDLEPVIRLIQAVRPWLGDLVFVGGWAHRLHRFHPLATEPSYHPLQTRDADLALDSVTPPVGDIGAALKAADFKEELSSDHTPPVTHYRLGSEDQGFYAEFLTPLRGSAHTRSGSSDATIEVAGVTAQKLRYVHLLLVHPWTVELGVVEGEILQPAATVRLANPVSFIVQKLLIRRSRTPNKQSQDALYIHDTLELFGRDLETLRDLWHVHVRPALAPKTAKRVQQIHQQDFGSVTDVIRAATRIPQDRHLTPERMQAACAYGLGAIFD